MRKCLKITAWMAGVLFFALPALSFATQLITVTNTVSGNNVVLNGITDETFNMQPLLTNSSLQYTPISATVSFTFGPSTLQYITGNTTSGSYYGSNGALYYIYRTNYYTPLASVSVTLPSGASVTTTSTQSGNPTSSYTQTCQNGAAICYNYYSYYYGANSFGTSFGLTQADIAALNTSEALNYTLNATNSPTFTQSSLAVTYSVAPIPTSSSVNTPSPAAIGLLLFGIMGVFIVRKRNGFKSV